MRAVSGSVLPQGRSCLQTFDGVEYLGDRATQSDVKAALRRLSTPDKFTLSNTTVPTHEFYNLVQEAGGWKEVSVNDALLEKVLRTARLPCGSKDLKHAKSTYEARILPFSKEYQESPRTFGKEPPTHVMRPATPMTMEEGEWPCPLDRARSIMNAGDASHVHFCCRSCR